MRQDKKTETAWVTWDLEIVHTHTEREKNSTACEYGLNARDKRSWAQLQSPHLKKKNNRKKILQKLSTCFLFSHSMAASGINGWTWSLFYFIIINITFTQCSFVFHVWKRIQKICEYSCENMMDFIRGIEKRKKVIQTWAGV